jgi:hypothetical protein
MPTLPHQENAMSLAIDIIRGSLRQQHNWWNEIVESLTQDQLHYRPDDKGNSIAFTAWHYARTEDNIVQFVFRERKPTVWMDGGYDTKFGMHRSAQGTGMQIEDAASLRLPSVAEWMAYQRAVWQATNEWLDSISESDLERVVNFRPFGEVTVGWTCRQTLGNHGYLHLGEAYHIRTMLGLINPELPETNATGM